MKKTISKKRSSDKLEKPLESNNSFLVETSFNSDIDMNIREEIDFKFLNSKINSIYKFPRTSTHKKTTSKQLSAKSFENLKKSIPLHKNSKSSLNPSAEEFKFPEKNPVKMINLNLKFPTSTKIGIKKDSEHSRVFSSRFLKTERVRESKSPRQKKSFVNIYKNSPKTGISDILKNRKSGWTVNTKMINANGSVRLRNIYKKVKGNNLVLA